MHVKQNVRISNLKGEKRGRRELTKSSRHTRQGFIRLTHTITS